MDVYKILVVGEPKTGKTSIISGFLSSDITTSSSGVTGFKSQNKGNTIGNPNSASQMDFVLKIITINGKKVRIQLWDMAGG